MERTRVLSHYVCEKPLEDGTMTLPGVWAIRCHAFMADEITLTTVNGKQWVVGVINNKDGKIILSGELVNQFNTHYNLVVSKEVEFQTGFGRNFSVRIRKYDGVEIDYESEDEKPNDRKNRVPPTLCIFLGEEALNAGILPIPASWEEQYTIFTGSTEVQVVVADVVIDNLGVEIDDPKIISVGMALNDNI
ncbi:hypothetical protein ACFE04_028101 [Oxalis oulophora]